MHHSDPPSVPPLEDRKRQDKRAVPADYVDPSAAALAALQAGIKSAQEQPRVYLGSFAKYATDE